MSSQPIKYVLLTGSDIGNRSENLRIAGERINALIGPITSSSSVHESEAWGFESETEFLNQALLVESKCAPAQVLEFILSIEGEMGRQRIDKQWTSRLIDIDIICAEGLILQTEHLTIPHKHLHNREFVLNPLSEIVPNWEHPILKKTYRQLLSDVKSVHSKPII